MEAALFSTQEVIGTALLDGLKTVSQLPEPEGAGLFLAPSINQLSYRYLYYLTSLKTSVISEIVPNHDI
jgi:hypothetical protein